MVSVLRKLKSNQEDDTHHKTVCNQILSVVAIHCGLSSSILDSVELGLGLEGGVGFVLMEGRVEKEHGANWVGISVAGPLIVHFYVPELM